MYIECYSIYVYTMHEFQILDYLKVMYLSYSKVDAYSGWIGGLTSGNLMWVWSYF